MRIHLDTDLGGDPDDICALGLLLGWPDVEIVGITTTIDPGGRRAGYAAYCLDLVGRRDIPLAAGAELSLTTLRSADPIVDDERYWPRTAVPLPARPGEALDLLQQSVELGATIVGIGPCTNLAMLEVSRPGLLGRAPVVVMGGWVHPPDDGLPAWGPDMDWNVQWDARAADIVAQTADLTLATLPGTMKGHLRTADLPRLRAAGPFGELLAQQAEVYGRDNGLRELGRAHSGLPDDLLNFHWDPLTCAVAVGWEGVEVTEHRLQPVLDNHVLRFHPTSDGRAIKVLDDVDGDAFTDIWLAAVESINRPST
ncbi:nucleoside hydrolase [Actinopolymorpha sp. B11F2]|uniref:nucleoside hydrolase n=1 Tax=Actinopolymorpha sp. B11F2 TaxID=3160862 RepID=UPI0032E44766